jgi:hypothetical protein
MLPTTERPYLSVVVVSRNDNHGGDLLLRTQAFLTNLATLAARHRVRTEVIMVEWNPPAGRAPLSESLEWPDAQGWCVYRVVEVPPERHARLRHAEHLPLFQMIGKNVGIRRATGRFVMATNIDLLFSDELFEYLSRKPLRKGRYYRVDRYDVPTEVAAIDSVDDQLAYCANAVMRVNAKFGIVGWDEWCRYSHHRMQWLAVKCFHYGVQQVQKTGARFGRLWQRACNKIANVTNYIRLVGVAQALAKKGPEVSWRLAKATALSVWGLPQVLSVELRRRFKRTVLSATVLHTNACGDFTLLSREDWDKLRGYAEFEIFSWHLDSLFIYSAFHGGAKEVVLPHAVYHIEHSGGWKPDEAENLWKRLDAKKITYLTNDDLFSLRLQVIASGGHHVFNTEDWGFASDKLPEWTTDGALAPRASTTSDSTLLTISRGQAA